MQLTLHESHLLQGLPDNPASAKVYQAEQYSCIRMHTCNFALRLVCPDDMGIAECIVYIADNTGRFLIPGKQD